jgi:hypothetical protein
MIWETLFVTIVRKHWSQTSFVLVCTRLQLQSFDVHMWADRHASTMYVFGLSHESTILVSNPFFKHRNITN